MKRVKPAKLPTRHQNFNLPLSIFTFFIGVIGTFMVTQVFAQTADTNQIYACVNETNGNVRIVTSNDTCKKHEKSIKWSIQGPPGPQGPAGSTGGLNQYFGLPFICNSCSLSSLADRFAGKDFSYAQITKSSFYNVNLQGVIFKNAFLNSVTFEGSDLTDADLSNMGILPDGSFPQNNNFKNTNLTNANFSSSLQHETNFMGANLLNADFSNTILRSAKFTGAQNMSTANFTGATFENVTCPDGANSNTNSNTCEGHY